MKSRKDFFCVSHWNQRQERRQRAAARGARPAVRYNAAGVTVWICGIAVWVGAVLAFALLFATRG